MWLVTCHKINGISLGFLDFQPQSLVSKTKTTEVKPRQAHHEQLGKFRLHQLASVGSNGCLGDWFIYQTECLHSQVGRGGEEERGGEGRGGWGGREGGLLGSAWATG